MATTGISYVRSKYAEEACDALYDATIDGKAFATQTAYVPTMRIKQWKPAQEAERANGPSAYCFMDNDPGANKQDYLLATATCDKSDPLFKDAPFITRVFADATQDRSQNYPFNKCVLEIDPTKVTREGLQAFWTNVERSDCDALFLTMRQEIQTMRKTMQDLGAQAQAVQVDTTRKERQAEANADVLSKVQNDETARQQRVDALRQQVASAQADVQRATKALQDARAECAYQTSRADQRQKDCDAQAKDWGVRLSTLQAAYTRTRQALQDTTQELQVLQSSYTVLYNSYTAMQAATQDLHVGLRTKTDALKQSAALVVACGKQLQACSKRKTDLESSLAATRAALAKCKGDLSTCGASRDQAAANLDTEREREHELALLQDVATAQLASCQSDRAGLGQTTTGLQSVLDRLRNTRQDCTPKLTIIDSLKKQITDTLGWCRIAADGQFKAADTDAAMVPILAAQTIKACTKPDPWKWTLEMWQDDNYSNNYFVITQDNLGSYGLYQVNDGRYAMTGTPFGTSSYKITANYPTFVEFYNDGRMTHRGQGANALGDIDVRGYNIVRG